MSPLVCTHPAMEVAHNLHRHTVDGGYTLVKIFSAASKREKGKVGM